MSRSGVAEVVALRATAPAEMSFTEDALVNSPLKAEFFKHLPGIFTGIGIIGTFAGLLLGLKGFQVTEDPGAARLGLDVLLRSVSEAFIVSACAIALAMIVTFIEKITLVGLYRKVQELTQEIDERFKAGVGEEYLARLVGASEESATQSRILKDALVGDLKDHPDRDLREADRRALHIEAAARAMTSAKRSQDSLDHRWSALRPLRRACAAIKRRQSSS